MVVQSRSRFRFRASGLFSLGLVAALCSAPRSARCAPLFTEDTLGSLGVGTAQACADSGDPGCYTNWFELADIDGDGDFDIVMGNGGGLFGPGNLEAAVVYTNDSKGAFLNVTNASFSGAPSQVRQVAVGDIDGDGDMDIYQPGAYGSDPDKLWVQTALRVFADQAEILLPASSASRAASTHFGDLDGDGDLDLLVADWGDASASTVSRVILYSNDGHGRFALTETQKDAPNATDHFPATIPATAASPYYGSRPTDLDLVDVDGDFDLDILINHREGYSRIFLNDGHGYFTDGTGFTGTLPADITANYAPKRGPYSNNQEACDLDGDGDLDLILDNAGKAPDSAPTGMNVTQLLFNDGHGVFVDQTATRIVNEPAAQDGAAKCADVNGDGLFDIVVGSRTHTSEKVLVNDGTGVFRYAADALPDFTNVTLAIDLGDLNGDGKIDLVTGQGEGTITAPNSATLRNNRVYYGLAEDITPPKFRAVEAPVPVVGAPIVFHVAISDSATNQAGQMAVLTVPYTVKGVTKEAKVSFAGGDLFRVVIPAQPNGTALDYTLNVRDRAKLTTKLSKTLYVGTPLPVVGVGGAGGESGEGGTVEVGAGGEGGADPSIAAGSGGTDFESGGAPAAPDIGAGTGGKPSGGASAGGTSPAGGEAGANESPASDSGSSGDEGCSCSTVSSRNGHSVVVGLGLALTLLGVSRRRGSKRNSVG